MQYSGTDGVADTVPDAMHEPIDFLKLFVDDSVLEMIITETNRNANQVIAQNTLSSEARIGNWVDTDKSEIRTFLGLLIWMGLVRMPTLDAYWRQSVMYSNSITASTMTRNRFQLLLRLFHFADNQAKEPNDKLHKVKELANMLQHKFQTAKKPGVDIVIDETMVPFRGRLSFRQYIPGKASKYGVKVFKLCDKNGYTFSFSIYAGKTDAESGLGLASDVVLKLTQPYLDAGRTLATDNYYTSVPLARALLHRKTNLVGTLRMNRKGLPESIRQSKLKKGEVFFTAEQGRNCSSQVA